MLCKCVLNERRHLLRRILTSKWFIIVSVVVLLLAFILLGLVPGSPIKYLYKPFGAILSPIQSVFKDTGNAFSDFWSAVTDGMAIRRENEELRAQIADLQYQLTQNEEAGIRYEELRDAFQIKDTFSNYDVYGASIVSREADEWFSVIRISSGVNDGIEVIPGQSLAVVDSSMNLIGRVIETSSSESKILPLLHEGFVVSAKINEVNGVIVTVSGDASLKFQGLCLVSGFSSDDVIEVGTEIVTSGNGGLFPQGIPIGVIESVDYSNPLNVTATLRPYSQIGDLKDVFIMIPQADAIPPADEDVASSETTATAGE